MNRVQRWEQGDMVERLESIDVAYRCAVCDTTRKTSPLRYFEDIGIVCMKCFLANIQCAVDGCDCLAIEDWLCHEHYMGIDIRYTSIFGDSSIAELESYSCDPPCIVKQLRDGMRKAGIPTKDNRDIWTSRKDIEENK